MPKRLWTRIDDLETSTPPVWAQGALAWWQSLDRDSQQFLHGQGATIETLRKTLLSLPDATRQAVIGILQSARNGV